MSRFLKTYVELLALGLASGSELSSHLAGRKDRGAIPLALAVVQ
jgi:hypothetical protein